MDEDVCGGPSQLSTRLGSPSSAPGVQPWRVGVPLLGFAERKDP